MNRTIKHNFFYQYPPEKVWSYLTDSALMAEWLMPNDFKPELGREFRFTIKPMPQFEFDGIVHCKVLEIVPYKKLSYSWKSGTGDGTTNLDSLVEWTLTEKDNGTELSLVHSGRMEHVSMYEAMNKGWHDNIIKINTLLTAKA